MRKITLVILSLFLINSAFSQIAISGSPLSKSQKKNYEKRRKEIKKSKLKSIIIFEKHADSLSRYIDINFNEEGLVEDSIYYYSNQKTAFHYNQDYLIVEKANFKDDLVDVQFEFYYDRKKQLVEGIKLDAEGNEILESTELNYLDQSNAVQQDQLNSEGIKTSTYNYLFSPESGNLIAFSIISPESDTLNTILFKYSKTTGNLIQQITKTNKTSETISYHYNSQDQLTEEINNKLKQRKKYIYDQQNNRIKELELISADKSNYFIFYYQYYN